MARKSHDDALGVTGAETIIGSGVSVAGELTSEADIDGLLDGNITTTGDVTIGVNASIKAVVKGNNVIVAGHLTGNIFASGDTTIRETGQVVGDITSSSLAIVPGGIFVGRNHMQVIHDLEPVTELTPPHEHKPKKL
jgi:cytoskeletal protein CcmA (bactofilin family)